jgi:hypothetical protein
MNCVIAICTRKTTHWYFKTFDFKRRDFWKSTGKKRGKKYGKKVSDFFYGKLIRGKKYGKKYGKNNTRKKYGEKNTGKKFGKQKVRGKIYGKKNYGRSRDFVTSGERGPTRADIVPVAHAHNILPNRDFRSRHFRSSMHNGPIPLKY